MSSLVSLGVIAERPEKINARHLEQTALVYIRQSSMQQVHRNQESTKIQYGLVRVAQELGWGSDRIAIIDDDLGVSGASAAGRKGFQRLLTEVALDHVGLIVGVEMSRLARSNKDWHQLLELCARFGTLIADLDGLYDPSHYNDRLLLGLKGTMSEAELHILRQRLLQGKLHKARRGELGFPVPTGYLRQPSGEVILDPDEEVQLAVRRVFEGFDRLGTTHGVLRDLVSKGVQIGVRSRMRCDLGQLGWRPPHRGMIHNILRNPIYAGAYAYGRRRTDPRRQQPGRPATGRTPLLPAEQWQVCLRDRFPAYISWEQYEKNQMRLNANRDGHTIRGKPRNGSALLGGLIVCGHCGYRMSVQYGRSARGRPYARYACTHMAASRGEAVCSGLSAARLDEVLSELTLMALEPAALELSMRVSAEIEQERAKAESLRQKRLQRARYEAERAERQYQAVEPENRLVARTLERAWEEKLQAVRALEEEYDRQRAQQPRHLTGEERETIRRLATDLPELWSAPTTTPVDRKQILRLLIDHIVVTVDGESEYVDVTVCWSGGHETTTRMRRPVAKLSSLSRHEELLAELRRLRREGYSAADIAEKLNDDGWVTPTQRNTFNERLIRAMVYRYGSAPKGPKRPPSDDPNDWRLADLANKLGMPLPTLYGWLRRGLLKSRLVRGQHVVIADAKEIKRLAKLLRPQKRVSQPATSSRTRSGTRRRHKKEV
jgi:DNA invertase Pin-like site-specific DNA recombinase